MSIQHALLSHNKLSGVLTPVLTHSTQLTALVINSNQISGSLPDSIGLLTTITTLIAHANNLDGDMPSLSHLRDLMHLTLFRNSLGGSLVLPEGSDMDTLLAQTNRLSCVIQEGSNKTVKSAQVLVLPGKNEPLLILEL